MINLRKIFAPRKPCAKIQKMKKFALICLFGAHVSAADISARFINAISTVESSNRKGPIYGDFDKKANKYRAIGNFQIHYSCWKDAVEFDKSIKGNYADCQDYNYSVKIFKAYLKRYYKFHKGNEEKMAKIWNGGLGGLKNPKTSIYWTKVKKIVQN